jgi:hypothetical protein
MKHLLNNMSEEEKNAIREQHYGGMKVMTENFNKLLNSKLGNVKPLVTEEKILREQKEEKAVEIVKDILKPEEIEFLKSEFISKGKEDFKDEVEDVMSDDGELSEDSEMSEKEYKLRHIINKIIKKGSVLAGLGIVPAAMFVSGGAGLALGITALVGLMFKDAAFWKKGGGHYYDENDKSDRSLGSILPSSEGGGSKDGSGNF